MATEQTQGVPLLPYEAAQLERDDVEADTPQEEDQGSLELESSADAEQDRLDEAEPDAEDEDDASESDEAELEDQGEETAAVLEIDGEPWTAEQIEQGVLRQADYTRKTQQLAEQRRALEAETEAERAQLREQRDTYADRLQQLAQAMEVDVAEPDWDKLAEDDPANFAKTFAAHQKTSKQRQAVRAEIERLNRERQEDFQKQLAAVREKENAKLLEAFPDWSDAGRREAAEIALFGYAANKYGFTEQEIGNVLDHRLIVMLDKARRYDELQEKGKFLLEGKDTSKVKILEPGARTPEAQSSKLKREVRRALKRAREEKTLEASLALRQAQRKLAEAQRK